MQIIYDLFCMIGFVITCYYTLRYWIPVVYKQDEFEHFGHYKVIAVNTCKGMHYPWRDKYEVSYHYVLQDEYEMLPPLYYNTVKRCKFDVGDSIYLKYRKNKV